MDRRTRVAGIWLSDNSVLLESLVHADVWGIPGGRLEDNESLEEGCRREYREETGIEVVCSSLAIVNENFWYDEGTLVREYGFYFRVDSKSTSTDSKPHVVSLEPELRFRWFELHDLPTITIVPKFLKEVLPGLPDRLIFVKTGEL